MIKNLVILGILALMSFVFHTCAKDSGDVVRARRHRTGGYYFITSWRRVWVNRSFREGSMTGNYRGGGPHAGK